MDCLYACAHCRSLKSCLINPAYMVSKGMRLESSHKLGCKPKLAQMMSASGSSTRRHAHVLLFLCFGEKPCQSIAFQQRIEDSLRSKTEGPCEMQEQLLSSHAAIGSCTTSPPPPQESTHTRCIQSAYRNGAARWNETVMIAW